MGGPLIFTPFSLLVFAFLACVELELSTFNYTRGFYEFAGSSSL